jgi:hypothetical protein
MERIEHILRRIQELYYSKHEKTGIDIDLMLDYTRVMYADLLEWRKQFKDIPAGPQPAVVPAPEQKEKPAAVAVPPAETITTEKPVAQQPDEKDVISDPVPVKAEDPEPEVTVAGEQKEEAEAEVIHEVLQNNVAAISFEPPAPKLPHTAIIEDVLSEEDALINTPVEDIILPEIEETPSQAEAKPHPVLNPTGPALKKDIRGAIGINDKYLFLNELFGNNKTDYEEALDQIRVLDNYEQAYNWLHTHPAKKNGWEEGDDTAQAFLTLVSQYFASR